MTIILRTVLLFLISIVLVSCGGKATVAPVTSRGADYARPVIVVSERSVYYTVEQGDTLYSIAWIHGHDYKTIAKWNAIGSPYRLYVGQKLRVKQPPQKITKAEKPVTQPDKNQVKKANKPRKTAAKQNKKANTSAKLVWHWPVKGKIIQAYSSRQPGKKGIVFGGKSGQSVYAATKGKVVYSGSGLVGYGKLIIIKHNEKFLSAYGHNKTLLVNEGDRVKAGQRIAEMGQSSADRVMLHFEIRRDGRPVNPLLYLPKQKS
ncbi:MAG: peptidoglycan DD-metalloendopeptidase family protein [Gammaproteobacteria bacterium]|nr:peptidoglycan DD-metalloendopeptidase family protein [Gammaproteobacteria bacterium]